MLELQARDVAAGVEAGRLPQQRADWLDLVLQRPSQRVEEVIVDDRHQVVHAPSKHENE